MSNVQSAVNFDTQCFHQALQEWREQHDCPQAPYEDLQLDARCSILRRAQEIKTSKPEENQQ